MDKTASLLRYRNRLIGILPTALVILGLIAEKLAYTISFFRFPATTGPGKDALLVSSSCKPWLYTNKFLTALVLK